MPFITCTIHITNRKPGFTCTFFSPVNLLIVKTFIMEGLETDELLQIKIV